MKKGKLLLCIQCTSVWETSVWEIPQPPHPITPPTETGIKGEFASNKQLAWKPRTCQEAKIANNSSPTASSDPKPPSGEAHAAAPKKGCTRGRAFENTMLVLPSAGRDLNSAWCESLTCLQNNPTEAS